MKKHPKKTATVQVVSVSVVDACWCNLKQRDTGRHSRACDRQRQRVISTSWERV